ncbi:MULTISPECIES: phosphoenolpyruvate hydrolase family protein [Pacificibacter]|uniref:phosphoenolpyruvate hydrolase family protein n=1 Tax=Pacificibacter TaxID=1042323 RepID=UPI001C0A526F|nr:MULTISPECIES: phosphoenolpyruvate hydrolase family protein [Pacificibacter]MBU2936380.1 phosphoenolpyruvate hydrolase family protein [Pacificibacter marinus]MDO6617345.1 phosphoenolpyruvate hydrolase family protein [Pacificibacter sp. 1_MG-2023]
MTSQRKTFLFGAVVGSGLTAQAADKAGADYLLALNAGRFRVQGASSLTSFLPVRPANEWVMEFAEREMLGRCTSPIYAGLSVSDPRLDIDDLLGRIKALGFSGVCNFPTTTSIDGRLGALFEREGLGFAREVALIERAKQFDLKSFVYVQNNAQARQMVQAGANAICVNIGFTGGATGVTTHLTIESAATLIDRALEGVPTSVNKLCHGGPITSPEEALAVTRISGVEGFVAGSTLDRLPLEQTLDEVTRGFTAIPRLARIKAYPDGTSPVLIGNSHAIQMVRKDIEDLAKEDIHVLITGETGTGKTLVASQIYEAGFPPARQPVVVDCAALDVDDGGQQLLGIAAGARGGLASQRGALELASGGMLIFEEIGALTRDFQGKILKFVDERLVQRIGENTARQITARVVCTSLQTAPELLESTSFRNDLLYRISGHTIDIPPLRERADDIPELAARIGRSLQNGQPPKFSNAALRLLMEHSWPGNVRELRNTLARALRAAEGTTVGQAAFDFLAQAPQFTQELPKADRPQSTTVVSERDWISEALARNGFRRAQTAQELGMTTRTLYNKIKKHGLLT